MHSITHLTSRVFRSLVIGRVVQKTIFLYKISGVPKWNKLNFFANPAYTILQLWQVQVYNRSHHVNWINPRQCDLNIELLQYNFFPNISVSFFWDTACREIGFSLEIQSQIVYYSQRHSLNHFYFLPHSIPRSKQFTLFFSLLFLLFCSMCCLFEYVPCVQECE